MKKDEFDLRKKINIKKTKCSLCGSNIKITIDSLKLKNYFEKIEIEIVLIM